MKIEPYLSLVKDPFLRLPAPARLVFSLVAGAIVVTLLTVGFKIVVWWVSTSQQSAFIEPRISQLLGYLQSEEQLRAALSERNQLLEDLAFPDSGDSGRGGALLQQEIRRLSSISGLTLIGSEVREPQPLENLLKLAVNVKVAGSPSGVLEFLNLLQAFRPFLFVSSMSIYGQRQVSGRRVGGVQQTESFLNLELDVQAYQLSDTPQ